MPENGLEDLDSDRTQPAFGKYFDLISFAA
jgi:hypothetical protein